MQVFFVVLALALSSAPALAEPTPPSLDPLLGAAQDTLGGALLVQQATTTYVFAVRGATESAVLRAASDVPNAVFVPVSAVNDLLLLTAGYVVVIVEFTGEAESDAEDAIEAESLEVIAFIQRTVFVDPSTTDGNLAACVDDACSFVRYDGLLRVELTRDQDATLVADTTCGTGDTDCDGKTTLFELQNGGDPFDPDA